VADNLVIKFFRGYFNMFSRILERKNRSPRKPKWQRRLTGRKFWISKPEIKHTNDRVTINLYIYNRQEKYFTRKIAKLLSYNLFKYINKSIKLNTKILLSGLKTYSFKLSSLLNIKVGSIKDIKIFYIKRLMKRSLKKEIFILNFMQSLFFNRLKFTSLYIEPLRKILTKLYNKKIILNIVKLKTYFLNVDILTQIVTTKTRYRRLTILRVLNASLMNIKTPVINKNFIVREATKLTSIQNIILNDTIINEKDPLNNFLLNKKKLSRLDILDTIKNKTVQGIRFEASGRLTRRLIASRAISKLKYIGTLKNVDSSYRGLSGTIVRGNIRSNTQLTKLKSKRRIGSFGMKG
jgi:hypothetical protein